MTASHRVIPSMASWSCALALGLPMSLATSPPCQAAEFSELEDLKRAVETLRAENRALSDRLAVLEAAKAGGSPSDNPTPSGANAGALQQGQSPDNLARRVSELEAAKAAQEDAVRWIIRDTVSTLGSKINESASLNGTLGVTLDRTTDFSGARKSSISLSSADFEFTIEPTDWALGHIQLEYVDGRNAVQRPGQAQANVDRITLDTAYISVGNPQKFPPVLTAGRMVLPFGISTGHPVADVLSVNSPLTVEAFETRQNAVGLTVAFPTPALRPPLPSVAAPVVRPLVVQPLIAAIGQGLGYQSWPTRPAAPNRIAAPPEAPPFRAGVYLYEGSTPGGLRRHIGGHAGLSTKGHCGKNYDELRGFGLCPWAVDIDLAYNSSLFASRFLEAEYASFLERIGRVPGLSASVKANLGPLALVGEWNGATRRARFLDDLGEPVAIKPKAWQISLAYQFGWNPWVTEIGAQGTYVSVSYSQSRDLHGATQLIDGNESLVGMLPRKRLLLTAGEWVLEGLRLTLEYTREWDYPATLGGTGRTGHGLATTLTYSW